MAKKINFEKMTIRQKINFVNKNNNLANIPFDVLIDVVEYDMQRIEKNADKIDLDKLIYKMNNGEVEAESIMDDLSTGCSKMGFYLSEYTLFEDSETTDDIIIENLFDETEEEFLDENCEEIYYALQGNAKYFAIKEIEEFINTRSAYIKRFVNADHIIKCAPEIKEIIHKYNYEGIETMIKNKLNKVFGIEPELKWDSFDMSGLDDEDVDKEEALAELGIKMNIHIA